MGLFDKLFCKKQNDVSSHRSLNIIEIESTMLNGSFNEKVELLSQLCDVFESYNKNIENFNDIMAMLIGLAIESKDENIATEILETICKGGINQNISDIDFDRIEENLDNVSNKLLSRYIDILSYTDNKKYLPSILRFKNHNNEYVKQAVEDAIVELGVK